MASQKLGDLLVEISANNTSLKKGLSEAKNLVQGFASDLKKLALELGAVYAAGLTMKGIVEAFSSAEVASNQLKASLMAVGASVDDNLGKLEAFNKKLSDNTSVGKTSAMEMERTALALGVPVQNLQQIVTAAVGLNRILGLNDVTHATQLATWAAEGYFQRLSRMIPQLRNVRTAEEGRALVGNMARKGLILEAEYMDTLEGKYIQFEKSLKGIGVTIGAIFAPALKVGLALATDFNIHIKDVIKQVAAANYDIPNLTNLFNSLFQSIQLGKDGWKTFGEGVAIVAKLVIESLDSMIDWVVAFKNTLGSVKDTIAGLAGKKSPQPGAADTGYTDILRWIGKGLMFAFQDVQGAGKFVANGDRSGLNKAGDTLDDLLRDFGLMPPKSPDQLAREQGDKDKDKINKPTKGIIDALNAYLAKLKATVLNGGDLPKLPGGKEKNDMYGFGKIFHTLGDNGPATGKDIRKGVDRIIGAMDKKGGKAGKPMSARGAAPKKPPKPKPVKKGPKKPTTLKVHGLLAPTADELAMDEKAKADSAQFSRLAKRMKLTGEKLWQAEMMHDAMVAVGEGRAAAGPGLGKRMGKDGAGEKWWQKIEANTRNTYDELRRKKAGLANTSD